MTIRPSASSCTANGYPGAYDKGKEIPGLDKLSHWDKGFVFHAGTAKENDRWLTTGGRVLGVTARGSDIGSARKKCLFRRQRDCLGRDALSQGHCSQGDS